MELLPIDRTNWEQVARLTTNPDGIPTWEERWIDSNACSMLQAFYEPGWQVRALSHNGVLVGFCMYGGRAPEIEIARFMIDRRYQNRGLGRMALTLLLQQLERLHPRIYISAEPENHRALHLYRSLGFCDTGTLAEGELLLCRESPV